MLSKDEFVVIPPVNSGRGFGWFGPMVFTPILGFSTLNVMSCNLM
jgi:hypothetical protein